MKKIIGFMFILVFLISCQISTSKTSTTIKNKDENSKANATFNLKINSGICANCD